GARAPIPYGQQPFADGRDTVGGAQLAVPHLEYGGPLLEGALRRPPVVLGGELGVALPQRVPQFVNGPDVVGAFAVRAVRAVAVRVQRGGEPAFLGAEFADQEVGGLQRDAAREVGAGGP